MHLSPTENHRHLMARITLELAYDGGDVKQWQVRLRRKLRTLVGDMPEERCDLRARSLWMREHPLGTIEKIAFTAEPYADVPAFVCLPKNVSPPYQYFICLQGHSTGMHNSIAVQRDDNLRQLVGPFASCDASTMRAEQRNGAILLSAEADIVSTQTMHGR